MGTWIEPYIKSVYDAEPFLEFLRKALPIHNFPINQVQSNWSQSNNTMPDYIKNKPSIPQSPVNADWNAISGLAEILNKPIIPAQFNAIAGANITLSGTYPNITFSATGSAATVTSLPLASSLGILANGTDQTVALNTVLSNANYAGVIIDYSPVAAITINGTLNCNGKILKFIGGNYITGSGTVDSALIDIDWQSQGFSTTITLTNLKTVQNFVSIKLYGAKGTGIDDTVAIQAVSDMMIANAATLTRNLVFPPGTYKITSPWLLYKWDGTKYQQWNLNILGANTVPGSTLTGFVKIDATAITDTFAIGLQRGYGTTIDGLYIQGHFQSYGPAFSVFVQTSFNTASPATRDSRYSPYSGIVIDFASNGGLPGDGGYPGLTSWYRGPGGNTGSTGVTVKNSVIWGFTVGICNSPNGFTAQGEDCSIINCQIDYAKVAISYGQSQSDRTKIQDCRSWYSVWTVIDTDTYGAGGGYIANIDGYNVAGLVNTLFNISCRKYVTIRNFYAESFFQGGNLQALASSISLIGCAFDFYSTDYIVSPQYHFTTNNVTFTACRMRYYDDLFNKRLRFQYWINTVFINCFFDRPPYCSSGEYISQIDTPRFINCLANNYLMGQSDGTYRMIACQSTPVAYGKFTIHDYDNDVTYAFDCTKYNYYTNNIASSVTLTPVSGVATITANTTLCQVNDIVLSQNNPIGRISAIDTVGGTITISEIPINVTAGTYVAISVVYFLPFTAPFVGDITSGSPNITNVCPLFGPNNTYQGIFVGQRIDHPSFPLGTYVVSYSGTTVVMSNNSAQTATRQNFANGNPQITVKRTYPPTFTPSYTFPFASGTVWCETVGASSSTTYQPNKWYFNQGGYLSASTLGLSSAFQADFNIEPVYRISSGSFQYFDNSTGTWTNA